MPRTRKSPSGRSLDASRMVPAATAKIAPESDAEQRALVREVGQHRAHVGEGAAHAQDRHAAKADQDADPGAEPQRFMGDEGREQGDEHRLGLGIDRADRVIAQREGMDHQRCGDDLGHARDGHQAEKGQADVRHLPAGAEHQEGQHAEGEGRAVEVAHEVRAIDAQDAANFLLHRRADVLTQRRGNRDRYPEWHASSSVKCTELARARLQW